MPPATTTVSGRPNRAAHSLDREPTGLSGVYDSSGVARLNGTRSGSTRSKKDSGGKPPQEACHMALCPEAQRERRAADLKQAGS